MYGMYMGGLTVDWTGWRGGLAGEDGRSGSGSVDRLGTGMLGEAGSGGTGVRVEEGDGEGEGEDGDCSRSGIWRAHELLALAAGHSGGCRYPCSPFVFDSVAARCSLEGVECKVGVN
jgi:hypothetical protein